MRNLFLLLVFCFSLAACNVEKKDGLSTQDITIHDSAEGSSNKNDLPVIRFEEETHHFGKITQGEKVSYSFKFTNTGKSNLIISSAVGSCGCTVAQPPKEPIAPGKEGSIDVVFNSDGKEGMIDKKITIKTNCEPNSTILTILAEIITPVETEPNKNQKK